MTGQPANEPVARVGRVVLGLVAGLIVGLILGQIDPVAAKRVVGVATPIGSLWINAVRMTVVPLVVSLLFISIADMGESTGGGVGVAREGIVSFATFLGLLALAALVAWLVAPALIDEMPLDQSTADALRASVRSTAATTDEQVRQLPGFASWVTSLAPVNVVKAAADAAMLPLIVFAGLFGLAARRIGQAQRDALLSFFRGIAAAMTTIVRWVIALAPIGVFALVLGPASSSGAALAGAISYYILSISLLLILFALLIYPVSTVAGIRMPVFVRGVFPAQAVALASSSSLASLPALLAGARQIGISERTAGFVLPLAVASFKVATPITWTVGSLFLAKLYGITLTPVTVLTIALTAVAASFSLPGIPQGALLLMAPVVASVGIPPEGVALLLAADTIPDIVGTMTNVTGDMVAATVVARACDEPVSLARSESTFAEEGAQ